MPIQIIAVGKQREHLLKLAKEYERRLSRYCRLSVVEVQDEKDPGDAAALVQRTLETEGQRILDRIRPQDIVVALCIEGSQWHSEELSQRIRTWHDESASVCFIIGGSLGLSQGVLQRANLKLSLSRMTFPHQLARVMLLEQLYRAYKIISGERYHK
ncbi:MAG: 23S rRNA (pseudouridine(1915)-N(3))-methyltransferase RlmH [Clostridiales bacterium]|nr:23S rRNA (pseudouridine(1915)-N(3))-methyltransferase RlmH [Clostridiales bacterium]